VERRSAHGSACFDHQPARDVGGLLFGLSATGIHLGRAFAEGVAYHAILSLIRGGRPSGEPAAAAAHDRLRLLSQNMMLYATSLSERVLSTPEPILRCTAGICYRAAVAQIPAVVHGLCLFFFASLLLFFFCDFERGLADSGGRGDAGNLPISRNSGMRGPKRQNIPNPTYPRPSKSPKLDWPEPPAERMRCWPLKKKKKPPANGDQRSRSCRRRRGMGNFRYNRCLARKGDRIIVRVACRRATGRSSVGSPTLAAEP